MPLDNNLPYTGPNIINWSKKFSNGFHIRKIFIFNDKMTSVSQYDISWLFSKAYDWLAWKKVNKF